MDAPMSPFSSQNLEIVPTVAYGTPAHPPSREIAAPPEETAGNPFVLVDTPAPAAGNRITRERMVTGERIRALDTLPTRCIVMGLIRLFQRRGILAEGELPRYITTLLDSGELDEGRPDEP
jgi:hypothetical protein